MIQSICGLTEDHFLWHGALKSEFSGCITLPALCLHNFLTYTRLNQKSGTCRTLDNIKVGVTCTELMWAILNCFPLGIVMYLGFFNCWTKTSKLRCGVIWSLSPLSEIQSPLLNDVRQQKVLPNSDHVPTEEVELFPLHYCILRSVRSCWYCWYCSTFSVGREIVGVWWLQSEAVNPEISYIQEPPLVLE